MSVDAGEAWLTDPNAVSGWRARSQAIGDVISRTESPIEAIMLVALFANMEQFSPSACSDAPWLIAAQSPIKTARGEARIDIEIIGEGLRVAIEVDGHAFHERSQEQVVRDNIRERALETEGWRVVRFSGCEVWRDPQKCVTDLLALLNAWKGAVGSGDPLEQAIIAFAVAHDAEVRWGYTKNRGT